VRKSLGLLLAVLVAVGCSKTSAAPSGGSEPSADAPGLGEVMVLVGRRFETAGKAAAANRFELAEFEVGELEELFEDDVPRAKLPKEGPTAQIPSLAKAFLATAPPELSKAAASRDQASFATAFRNAAALCNACHQSAEKGFIQVPSVPGQSVPVMDPLPASSTR
jgi:cytochrome c553